MKSTNKKTLLLFYEELDKLNNIILFNNEHCEYIVYENFKET